MKVQIPASAIRAASFCMAQKDSRTYINGVFLDVTGPTEAFVVSTDGYTLFAGRVELEYLEGAQVAPWHMTIPADIIKRLDKKATTFVLESLPDGRYMLDGKAFAPVDGKFPDYRRVIPNPNLMSGEAGKFNPELVLQCVKSILEFYGYGKTSGEWEMKQNGAHGSASIFGQDASAVAVVMPMNNRHEKRYHGLLSPCQSFQMAA